MENILPEFFLISDMKKLIPAFLLALIFCLHSFGQSAPPFWNEILEFKKADSASTPQTGKTLFIGSSSFTRWTDLNKDFPNSNILNRAFGGSTLPDVTRYYYEVVQPYQPSKVFIYCGENDLAASDSLTAESLSLRFQTLYQMIVTNFPSCKIYYVSIKPSPSRKPIQPRAIRANQLIKKFLASKKRTGFIDIYRDMLDAKGNMREELYVEDRLHMNAKGYEIWIRKMKPYIYN